MTTDSEAPHGRDAQGRARAPYGRKADGTVRLKPGRGRRNGAVEKTKTGWRARYTAPDGSRPSKSFPGQAKGVAEAWLLDQLVKVGRGEWKSREKIAAEKVDEDRQAAADGYTLKEWSEEWLRGLSRAGRTQKTVQTHRYRLSAHVLPSFGDRPLRAISEEEVTEWFDGKHAACGRGVSRPLAMTMRAMLNAAVKVGKIKTSPFTVSGATKHRPTKMSLTKVATPDQVAELANAMPEHLRIAVHLAMWCQLREGEVLELRRRDVDLKNRTLTVSRQVQFIKGEGPVVSPPKSDGGTRTIAIIDGLIPLIEQYILKYAGQGRDGLIVPHPVDRAKHLHHNTFRSNFNRARDQVDGLDGFVFHDLRHSGLTEYARQGATIKEIMHRGGHKDPQVALRYQHAERDRDRMITNALASRFTIGKDADVIQMNQKA